jgi:hypothetical protein
MLNRTKIVLVMLVIAMLATPWGMVGTAVAQKAAVPKPQDKLAIGEDEAKQLLLLVDTEKKGKVSKQEWMKFMEAEFDRLDKAKSTAWRICVPLRQDYGDKGMVYPAFPAGLVLRSGLVERDWAIRDVYPNDSLSLLCPGSSHPLYALRKLANNVGIRCDAYVGAQNYRPRSLSPGWSSGRRP